MIKKYISKIPASTVLLSLLIVFQSKAEAQISVKNDLTLPNNTTIKIEGNRLTIDGGTQVGKNLFHSFQTFSLSQGETALFNNASNIANILVRVTGGSGSSIDGMISANGIANLFFLNPSGISFGKNAQLKLGGSFLGTTASAFTFGNGLEYSATKPQAPPLLAINIPIGLRFDGNPGAIQVSGTGQGLTALSTSTKPIARNSRAKSLSVEPNQTLALVGGDINLEAGNLVTQQGNITLGSVDSGIVEINPKAIGWSLNYDRATSFKEISLSKQSLVDASGDKGGSISINGKDLFVTDGSGILIQNNNLSSGDISVKASDLVKISGIAATNGSIYSVVRTESLGSGDGGNLNINTKDLVLEGGGNLGSRNYSFGRGGNTNISAWDSVQLLGYSSNSRFFTSSIISTAIGSAKGGDVVLTTGNLLAENGGLITSLSTRGNGQAGNVDINASSIALLNSDQLISSGTNLKDYVGSYIGANTFGAGNAGILTINAQSLLVGKQASVNTTSVGAGAAGTLNINVPEIKIDADGDISSAVSVANQTTQQQIGAPSIGTGNPGDVTINTDALAITGGLVSVRNLGTGDGGTLKINANSIHLNNNGSIAAATASGEGGNITLNAKDLQLRNGSSITASAGNRGDGGNININAGTLTALEQSSITANAFEGKGGNIKIDTQGLFLSPESKITATSEKGVNGTVKFIAPGIDLLKSVALIPPAVNTPEPSNICNPEQSLSTLVKTGTGGTPFHPSDTTTNNTVWNQQSTGSLVQSNQPQQYVEAHGWVLNPDGKTVRFVADPELPVSQNSSIKPNCH